MFSLRNAVFLRADRRVRSVPKTRTSPAVGLQNSSDHREQRRFAATARADEERQFAGLDIQIHAPQCGNHHASLAELLGQRTAVN